MAGLDESVRNLERFNGLLATATGEVEDTAKEIRHAGQGIAQLAEEAGEAASAFADRLDDFESALESLSGEATEAIEDLRTFADEGKESLAEAQERLDGAVDAFEQRVHDVEAELDTSLSQIVEQGFQPLDQALADSRGALAASGERFEGLTAEMAASLAALQPEGEAAWDLLDRELEQAAADSDHLGTSIEGIVTDAVDSLGQAAAGLERACSSLETDLTAIYAGLVESANAQQQALSEAARRTVEESASRVEEVEDASLAQPTRAVEDCFGPLETDLAQVVAVLESGAVRIEALPALTADLATCQGIVGQIDALLQAIAG